MRPARPTLKQTFRALQYRNFRLFFAGQLTSLIGTWMQTVAQSWLVYKLTGSAAQLGAVGFCSQIPVFVLATVGGMAADRFNLRRMLVVTQSLAMVWAFILSWLTLSGHVQVWHIYVLATLLGTVNAFDIPGRQAFAVQMVGKVDLPNAIALNSTMFNGARIVGPALAGLLVAAVGEGWCFFLNGVSYLAVIVSLLAMRLEPVLRAPTSGSLLEQSSQGFRYVYGARPVRYIFCLLGLISVTGMPYAVLMPIFAARVLHGGSQSLGLLMAATGLGALAGALTMATRDTIAGLPVWIGRAALGFGAALVLFSRSDRFWLSFLLILPAGYAAMIQLASSNTMVQSLVPDQLRGRVMALYSMTFMGLGPFGSLLAGKLADRFGAPDTVLAGGLTCMLGALAYLARVARD